MPAKRAKKARAISPVVNRTELAILEALATFRFLTPAQIRALGIAKHKRFLYGALTTLRERTPAPVKVLRFGVLPGRGQLPWVYYLTPQGAELLAEARREDTPPPVPQQVRAFPDDYDHRVGCIDIHIALALWAARHDARVDFFHTYFDYSRKEDDRPVARTRVALRNRVIIPDAIFSLTTRDATQRLFAVELSAGREVARIERQLSTYRYALHEAAIETAYDYPNAVRVLCVFEHERTLASVLGRVVRWANASEFREHFLFKTLPEVQADFLHGWRQIGGCERVSLFPQ